MLTSACWMRRLVVGFTFAATLLTGEAHAQSGRAVIRGRVIATRPGEESPRGLGGVTVELRNPNGAPLPGPAFAAPKTGEEGTFTFEEVPMGEYLLRAFTAGYAPYEAKIYCTSDSVTQLTVRLERSVAGLAPGQKKTPRDPLPGAGKIVWDVRVFEESPFFDLVRREVKDRKVTWLLENIEDNPGRALFHRADFIDSDGVTFLSIGLATDPAVTNWRAGERNRLILTLPENEHLQRASRIVLSRSF